MDQRLGPMHHRARMPVFSIIFGDLGRCYFATCIYWSLPLIRLVLSEAEKTIEKLNTHDIYKQYAAEQVNAV